MGFLAGAAGIVTSSEFAAWVPNVSGHMSFSAVGIQLVGRSSCYNNLNGRFPNDSLYVLAGHTRPNRDTSAILRFIGRFLGPSLRKISGSSGYKSFLDRWIPEGLSQEFFLVASPIPTLTPYFDQEHDLQHRPDERGGLEGTVFVLAQETEQPYRSAQVNQLKDIRRSIQVLNGLSSAEEVKRRVAAVRQQISSISDAHVNFTLYRTGECRLRMAGSKIDMCAEDTSLLVKHAYYFVRDCAHRHYHHADSDDRLLPAVALDSDTEDPEVVWRREVLWAISRTIGEYRRSRSMSQRRQALGITAYADAFQATLARIRRTPDGPEPHAIELSLATFDFGHLKESAKVANEVSAWQRQGGFSVAALAIATTLSLTALWVAISRLGDTRHWNHSGPFAALAQTFYSYPGYVLSGAFGLIYLVWDVTYSDRPRSRLLFKTLLALSWPGKSDGSGAEVRLYGVCFIVAILLSLMLDFQFGIWVFSS